MQLQSKILSELLQLEQLNATFCKTCKWVSILSQMFSKLVMLLKYAVKIISLPCSGDTGQLCTISSLERLFKEENLFLSNPSKIMDSSKNEYYNVAQVRFVSKTSKHQWECNIKCDIARYFIVREKRRLCTGRGSPSHLPLFSILEMGLAILSNTKRQTGNIDTK